MLNPVYLFISPHLDDAALSCGGYIHRLSATGHQVVMVTVVTADVASGGSLPWVARRNHRAWRLYNAPFAARSREDAAAAKLLGASHLHLGLIDAIYRRDATGAPLYRRSTVGVSVHPYDWKHYEPEVRERLEKALRSFEGREIRVFCPLSAGRHVDHVIVRRAVETVCEPEIITYYEDYPYATRLGTVEAARGCSNGSSDCWFPTKIRLDPKEIDARIAAVSCYSSQVPGLFPSLPERWLEILRARLFTIPRFLDRPPNSLASEGRMASRLGAYIARVGGERYWDRYDAPVDYSIRRAGIADEHK